MTVETIRGRKEFEQIVPHEIERKFMPVFPERLEPFRAEAIPIEQFYLSHPSEPFSLRMRETTDFAGNVTYVATLKDRGNVTDGGLDRLEVSAPLTKELYEYYRDEATVPILRKLRAEPLPGVVIDFYDDGSVRVESESPESWSEFVREQGDHFVDITGDRFVDNEWHAHLAFRRQNDGHEALTPDPELSIDDIVRDILAGNHSTRTVVHIGGRSGSGKSTIVRALRQRLTEYKLSSVVTSTDDYHRGTAWLTNYNGGETWTHWDESIVYDTDTMAAELNKLRTGVPIDKREIDWQIAEPVVTGKIEPADVIIVEGIYATAPEITDRSDLEYVMTTPLATCVGRRLLRDLLERPQFADPVNSLGYMLSEAETAYRKQHSI